MIIYKILLIIYWIIQKKYVFLQWICIPFCNPLYNWSAPNGCNSRNLVFSSKQKHFFMGLTSLPHFTYINS